MTTSTTAPHTAHEDHGHDNQKQTFVVTAAGLWSVVFTVIVYAAITGWFIPNVRADIPTAIISTARIVGAVGAAALVHVLIQLALITNRPGRDAPYWQRMFDYVTSFLPLFGGVVLGHIVAATQYGDRNYAQFWIEIRFWIDVMVIIALIVDLYPTIKIMIYGRPVTDDHH